MELYKLLSENEIKKFQGGFVVVDNHIYTNPKEETIKKAGYKPLLDAPVPEFDIQNQYITLTYREEDSYIIPVYSVQSFEVQVHE